MTLDNGRIFNVRLEKVGRQGNSTKNNDNQISRMKKYLIFIIAALSLFVSCGDDSYIKEEDNLINSLDNYAWVGELHNQFLDGVYDGVTELTRSESAEIDWEQINVAQINQAQSLLIDDVYKNTLVTSLKRYKPYYHTDVLFAEAFPNNSVSNLKHKISELYNKGQIDSYEGNLLYKLIEATHRNMSGEINNVQLSEIVEGLCNRWQSYYGNKENVKGEYSAYILSQ